MTNANAWTQDGTLMARRARPVKVCHRCGQDLSRQRRYRDQSGYWCVACSKADKKAYRANHLPCDDCGCDVQRGREYLLDDYRLCEVCWQARQTETLRQQMLAEAAEKTERRRERRKSLIRKWAIASLELIVACAFAIYIYRSAADRTDSADAQLTAATTRPQAAATQPGEDRPAQFAGQTTQP